jgi:hypothetical protein
MPPAPLLNQPAVATFMLGIYRGERRTRYKDKDEAMKISLCENAAVNGLKKTQHEIQSVCWRVERGA